MLDARLTGVGGFFRRDLGRNVAGYGKSSLFSFIHDRQKLIAGQRHMDLDEVDARFSEGAHSGPRLSCVGDA